MRRCIEVLCSTLCFFSWILSPNRLLADDSPYHQGFGGKLPVPRFTVSWLDDKTVYKAGDIAIIKITILDDFFGNKNFNLSRYAMYFSLSVCGKKGNSSYISGVIPYFEGDPSYWNVSFTPIRVGEFSILVTEDNFGITDSSLHFIVTPGHIYPSVCQVSWMNLVNAFVAGTKAYLRVIPKDAFGNNISSIDGPKEDYFTVSGSYDNGTAANVLDFRFNGWSELGYGFEFVPIASGSLLLHVYGDNQTLRGAPLPFLVKPGSMNITNSLASWKYGTNSLQIFSKLEIFIHQKDQFGNLVPGFYAFDARVVQKATNLSVPVADLIFQEVSQGIQLLSFVVTEPGEFLLYIFNAKLNESISKIPYQYIVFIGYCHGLNSFANGSGVANSVSGRMSRFTVYLEDLYHNPSPIEAQWLHVTIFSKNGTLFVRPVIFPLRRPNGTAPGPTSSEGPSASLFSLPANEDRTFIGNPSVLANEFSITYIAEKSGEYEIQVLCGNIPLNDGHPYLMKVSPGLVDTSLSRVLNFLPRVKKLMRNAVYVQLLDAFSNSISSQQTKLSFDIKVANSSNFMRWAFVDNNDGSYHGYYLSKDVGTYNMCISYADRSLPPCPFEVQVYERNYFSEAYNESISVWEDESVSFDVLANDYVPGGQFTITETSIPRHGSLLQYGKMFRYTPHRGYFGNDSFFYSFSDINQNVAIGTAFLSVLCKPPQFVSLPDRLHATEDLINPKFGGFSGFELMYSDVKENITLTIIAQSGTAFLAPMQMQIGHPSENILSVSRGGRTGKDLILSGCVEMINYALQSIQYLGNENFYGNDIIGLYTMNINGVEDSHVSVFVEPINDPPIINTPKFIILGRKEANNGFQIFDKQRDAFEFSIGDTDIFSFPGNKSHLIVTFSLEVNDGVLSTSLPAHLIKTAELKSKSSNQWQPPQTFVTISKHFVLRGKGIRFQGTVGDCNSAMQQLFYHGEHHGCMLTITVNDLGNYGCYPDCTEMMSLPLFTEATVNLIRMRPIGSLTAFLLGSAIILEIVMMMLLGGALLLFICKCMTALHSERNQPRNNTEFLREEHLDNQTVDDQQFQNGTNSNGSTRTFVFGRQQSSFQRRSRQCVQEQQSQVDELPPSSSSQFAGDYTRSSGSLELGM